MDLHLLSVYLRDHITAAYGGVALARRIESSHDDPRLTGLGEDIEADLRSLLDIARSLGVRTVPERRPLVALGERLGRLWPNGALLHRTGLTDVVELELMAAAVTAKRTGWRTLREVAAADDRLDAGSLDGLVLRADDQLERLDAARSDAVRRAFETG